MNALIGEGRREIDINRGTSANHARKGSLKFGNERMRSTEVTNAPSHSTRVGDSARIRAAIAANGEVVRSGPSFRVTALETTSCIGASLTNSGSHGQGEHYHSAALFGSPILCRAGIGSVFSADAER